MHNFDQTYEHVQQYLTNKNSFFIYTVHPEIEIARLHLFNKECFEAKYNLLK